MISRRLITALCCLAAIPSTASAVNVVNPNFSFESPDVGGFQDNNGLAAGRACQHEQRLVLRRRVQRRGSPVGVEQTSANGNQTGVDLTQSGYVNVGAAMSTTNLTPIVANATYNLTVSVAGRFSGFNSTAGATIALASNPTGTPGDVNLDDPVNWLGSTHIDFATLQSVGNAFADYTVNFVAPASGPAIGRSIVVVLQSENNAGFNNPIGFDNVRLVASVVNGPGDVDGNGVVNLLDFAAIRDNFRKPASSRQQGDLNGDAFVNLLDYREWKANYTGLAVPNWTSVPEPTTGAMLLAAGLMANSFVGGGACPQSLLVHTALLRLLCALRRIPMGEGCGLRMSRHATSGVKRVWLTRQMAEQSSTEKIARAVRISRKRCTTSACHNGACSKSSESTNTRSTTGRDSAVGCL